MSEETCRKPGHPAQCEIDRLQSALAAKEAEIEMIAWESEREVQALRAELEKVKEKYSEHDVACKQHWDRMNGAERRAAKAEAELEKARAERDQLAENNSISATAAMDSFTRAEKAEAEVSALKQELEEEKALRENWIKNFESERSRSVMIAGALFEVLKCLEGYGGHENCDEICSKAHVAVNVALSSHDPSWLSSRIQEAKVKALRDAGDWFKGWEGMPATYERAGEALHRMADEAARSQPAKKEKPEWYATGKAGTKYTTGHDPEVTCWHCDKTFLCDPMDACCRMCGAPYDKNRCAEFGFQPDKGEANDAE